MVLWQIGENEDVLVQGSAGGSNSSASRSPEGGLCLSTKEPAASTSERLREGSDLGDSAHTALSGGARPQNLPKDFTEFSTATGGLKSAEDEDGNAGQGGDGADAAGSGWGGGVAVEVDETKRDASRKEAVVGVGAAERTSAKEKVSEKRKKAGDKVVALAPGANT